MDHFWVEINKDAKQLSIDSKRFKLTATAQRECRELDAAIPQAEKKERAALPEDRLSAQTKLLALRQRFGQLSC